MRLPPTAPKPDILPCYCPRCLPPTAAGGACRHLKSETRPQPPGSRAAAHRRLPLPCCGTRAKLWPPRELGCGWLGAAPPGSGSSSDRPPGRWLPAELLTQSRPAREARFWRLKGRGVAQRTGSAKKLSSLGLIRVDSPSAGCHALADVLHASHARCGAPAKADYDGGALLLLYSRGVYGIATELHATIDIDTCIQNLHILGAYMSAYIQASSNHGQRKQLITASRQS